MSIVRISVLASIAALVFPSVAHAAEPEKVEKRTEIDPKKKLLWLDVEGGVQSASLNTFTTDWRAFSVGFIPRSGTGPAAGAAIGLRLVFLTLGVRGRVATFQNDDASQAVRGWTMSSINGELGLRVPLRRLEPFLTLGAGYTTFGGFGTAIRGLENGMNVNGVNARAGLGFDYFLSRHVSLGALGTAELLALTRPGVPVRTVAALPASDSVPEAANRFLAAEGSSYGTALSLTGGLKAHF